MTAPATPRRRFIPIKDAAERLSVHENTIRNWIDSNVLRAYRLPSGVRRLPVDEVERLEHDLFAVPTSFFDPASARMSERTEPVTSATSKAGG